ncbi:MAG: hypothetical protein ACE5H8_05655 [Alphaproteobacteria bacterium]
MTSLYLRLFRYRQREGRSPLEDFLTEAFADLLNRLPKQNHMEFCEKVLLAKAPPDVKKKWRCFVKTCAGDLHWKTQYRIEDLENSSQKRLDIVLLSGDRPVLVVECKIRPPWAAIRKRTMAESSGAISFSPMENGFALKAVATPALSC